MIKFCRCFVDAGISYGFGTRFGSLTWKEQRVPVTELTRVWQVLQ